MRGVNDYSSQEEPEKPGKDDVMTKLSDREELFCRMYVTCRNGAEAAVRSGYKTRPDITAVMLLAKKNIRKTIERMEKENTVCDDEVRAGLRRIAFASSADAVRLLLADGTDMDAIDGLDLFNVSEIKRTKGGAVEIKFFDRIKALEKLGELTSISADNNALPFYRALEKGAEALDGDAK